MRGTAKPQAASGAPFARESQAATALEFRKELAARGLQTIRQRTREHAEQTWEDAVAAMHPGEALPPHPKPAFEPAMQVEVPSERLDAQWKLGAWHILRRSVKDPNGKWQFNDFPFGILASETYMILRALDLQGMHKEAADGLDQWLRLPMEPKVVPGQRRASPWALPDRPLGHFSDGKGCLTHAEGLPGAGGHMDGVHAMGPGAIMFTLIEHFRLTGDRDWLKANAPRMKANAEWILRQRRLLAGNIPGGERLWSKGLQPAHVVTPDSERMHMQFYESEAYYWLAVKRMAELLAPRRSGGRRQDGGRGGGLPQGPPGGDRPLDRAHAGGAGAGRDLPLVHPLRAVRARLCLGRVGLAAVPGARRRDLLGHGAVGRPAGQPRRPAVAAGPARAGAPRRAGGPAAAGEHEGRATAPAGFDPEKHWFSHASWQYQCGLERHANIHLAADDVPNFLRSMLNQYAVDIMPGEYTFREHTTGGPPDKIFEESCFLERFRQMLVMEEGDDAVAGPGHAAGVAGAGQADLA